MGRHFCGFYHSDLYYRILNNLNNNIGDNRLVSMANKILVVLKRIYELIIEYA